MPDLANCIARSPGSRWAGLLLAGWLMLTGGPTALAQDGEAALKRVLDRYVGTWEGTFTIRTADGRQEKAVTVEQQYWWEEGELRGLSVYEDEGKLTFSNSINSIVRGILFSEVSQNDRKRYYRGMLVEQTVVWFPVNPQAAANRQIKETILRDDGELVLITEGFERLDPDQANGRTILYQGRLVRTGDS
ncbi:MAG: hypothetical protein ACFE0O_00335 [Opitutales bacterium]